MLDFFFDYRSPYSYLANTRLPGLHAEVRYYGIDIVEVMRRVHNQPSPKCPAKARYSVLDAARWASHYGVAWAPNKALLGAMRDQSFDGSLLCRAGLAAVQLGVFESVHAALFAVVWAGADDVLSQEGRFAFLRKHAVDVDIWAQAGSEAVQVQLESNNAFASTSGVFGVPSFLVNGELFFGNDRLEFVRSALGELSEGVKT